MSGRGFFTALADAAEHAGFTIVLLVRSLAHGLLPRSPVRHLGRVFDQGYVQIVKSLPVVAIVGIFSGMILALQSGETLASYGVEGRLGGLVAGSMAREMGPFITSVILAATVGAAIAAELGTMKVSEEIDALELMNVDPIAFLAAPRVLVFAVATVLLTGFVDVIGTLGGALVANSQFGTSYSSYFESARVLVSDQLLFGALSKDVYSGLTKAFVFGLMNGAIACATGLTARGGALGVGRAVRQAVVASVLTTLIVGYIITWVFWA